MISPVERSHRLNAGFTLVELMIALVLGLIVIGGSLAVFVSQRVTNSLSSQMADVQNEGRLALDALSRDIRAAGDFGCWPVTTHYVRLHSTSFFQVDQAGIRGFSKASNMAATISASGLAGAQAVAEMLPQSDVLIVAGISGSLAQVTTAVSESQTDPVIVSKPSSDFRIKDVVVITDCLKWSMFEVTGVTAVSGTPPTVQLAHAVSATSTGTVSGGNKFATLGAAFKSGATVGSFDYVWWFVAEVSGKKGLYRLSARELQLGGGAQLVSNRIQDMRLRYELDTDDNKTIDQAGKSAGDIDASAADALKWTGVRRAVLEVLARSEKPSNTSSAVSYTFGGASVTPTDKHLYLPLELAVALRNQ